MQVAVVGSYGVGLTMHVERVPRSGETLADGVFITGHGGKGSNQAVAAARLGAQVSLLTAIGTDQFGDSARELWRDEGVAAEWIDATGSTMVGVILVEAGGENRIVIAPGALTELSPSDVDAFEPRIAAADVLVTGFEIPVDVARRALELARRHGVRTLLNPAPAPAEPLDPEMWGLVDVVTPNESEARALTGDPDLDSPDACADAIRTRFSGITIITLGSDGCLVDQPNGDRVRIAPVRPSRVVDTTGAGDAFTGALAVALSRGDQLNEAVLFASAAGAYSVSTSQVIPSLARQEDIQALLADGAIR